MLEVFKDGSISRTFRMSVRTNKSNIVSLIIVKCYCIQKTFGLVV